MNFSKHVFILVSVALATVGASGDTSLRLSKKDSHFDVTLNGIDALGVYQVFSTKEYKDGKSFNSIKCFSENECKVNMIGDIYGFGYRNRIYQIDEWQTHHGVDLKPLVGRLTEEGDRMLLAPMGRYPFWEQHNYVKSFSRMYKKLSRSKSPFISQAETDEYFSVQLSLPNVDISCIEYKNPKIETQADVVIPHSAVLRSNKFSNSHFCSTVIYSKLIKTDKPTFVVDPNGLTVKIVAFRDGQFLPVPGIGLTLGGNSLIDYFKSEYRSHVLDQVTNESGIIEFSKKFEYFYDDIEPMGNSLYMTLNLINLGSIYPNNSLDEKIVSLLRNETIESCNLRLDNYVGFYHVSTGNRIERDYGHGYGYLYAPVPASRVSNDQGTKIRLAPRQQIQVIVAGTRSKWVGDKQNYELQDINDALAKYKADCQK